MLDALNLFSDDQTITGDAVSTNFINLGTPATPPGSPAPLKRDIGGGNNVPILIEVTETFAGLTSLTATIEVSATADFATTKEVGSTGAILAADLVVGKTLPLNCVPFGADQQYMRLNYDVVGTATAGSIIAGITTGISTNVGQ